jgi:putative ABC transport system permease protein
VVTFLSLILHNLGAKRVRSALTAAAVALGVVTVVTLGVVTHSLQQTATSILQTGKADFTISQKRVSDLLSSSIDQAQLARIQATPGVRSAIGVLIDTAKLNAAEPLFLQIGIAPEDLAPFGVTVVAGRAFQATAPDELMLGFRAAESLGKHVGDTLAVGSTTYRVVGIYSTGQAIGDAGSTYPRVPFQAAERKPGENTLVFVQARSRSDISSLQQAIDRQNPELVAIRTAAQFGQADRNLVLFGAADTGSTVLAIVIGAVIVANTMLLSFVERVREFGIIRAVGWTRRRLVAMMLGEAVVLSVFGALAGVALSFLVTWALPRLPGLVGVLHVSYTSTVFWRGLYTGLGVALLGAAYPALRAAMIVPLRALNRE